MYRDCCRLNTRPLLDPGEPPQSSSARQVVMLEPNGAFRFRGLTVQYMHVQTVQWVLHFAVWSVASMRVI